MKLSQNFSLHEFTRSRTASKYGITEQWEPPTEVIANLKRLCIEVLQPLRDCIDKPLKVNSGYRCPRVNHLVGGSSTSLHLTGCAADLELWIDGVERNDLIWHAVLELCPEFTEMIWEYGDQKRPAWIHIGFDGRNKQTLKRAAKRAGSDVFVINRSTALLLGGE